MLCFVAGWDWPVQLTGTQIHTASHLSVCNAVDLSHTCGRFFSLENDSIGHILLQCYILCPKCIEVIFLLILATYVLVYSCQMYIVSTVQCSQAALP